MLALYQLKLFNCDRRGFESCMFENIDCVEDTIGDASHTYSRVETSGHFYSRQLTIMI